MLTDVYICAITLTDTHTHIEIDTNIDTRKGVDKQTDGESQLHRPAHISIVYTSNSLWQYVNTKHTVLPGIFCTLSLYTFDNVFTHL